MKVWLTLEYYKNANIKFSHKINMPMPPCIGMFITSNEIKGLVEQIFWDVDQQEMRVILDRKTVYIMKDGRWVMP